MKFLFGQFLGHPVGQFFGSPYHQKSYFKLGSRTFLFCRATVAIINVIFDGAPISSPSMKIYIYCEMGNKKMYCVGVTETKMVMNIFD